jgi:transposase
MRLAPGPNSWAAPNSPAARGAAGRPHSGIAKRLHFTPTYSSWLNQVELWFAKIEREDIARSKK